MMSYELIGILQVVSQIVYLIIYMYIPMNIMIKSIRYQT